MSIKKRYLKNGKTCNVTFKLPKEAVKSAEKVTIVGDFNNWDMEKDEMKQHKNGDFSIMLKLETGYEYQYRYLLDDQTWENDWDADKYVPSPYGDSDNSIVIV